MAWHVGREEIGIRERKVAVSYPQLPPGSRIPGFGPRGEAAGRWTDSRKRLAPST